MKYRINNIYDDLNTLITDNTLLSSDERLNDLMELAPDLDVIIDTEFGERELFANLLKEDDTEIYTYNLPRIWRSVYACFLGNLSKYNALLSAVDSLKDYDANEDYKETKIFGEREKTNTYGATLETKQFGATQTTKTYGNVVTTTNTGQSTDTTTNGERVDTNAVNPSFSSSFTDTDKATKAQSQDTTQYGARQDTENVTHGNDTIADATHTDTRGTSQHVDGQVETESTDIVKGYKNKLDLISKELEIARRLELVKMIANDVVNQVSYNLYL